MFFVIGSRGDISIMLRNIENCQAKVSYMMQCFDYLT